MLVPFCRQDFRLPDGLGLGCLTDQLFAWQQLERIATRHFLFWKNGDFLLVLISYLRDVVDGMNEVGAIL
jgi:hypothetical protein